MRSDTNTDPRRASGLEPPSLYHGLLDIQNHFIPDYPPQRESKRDGHALIIRNDFDHTTQPWQPLEPYAQHPGQGTTSYDDLRLYDFAGSFLDLVLPAVASSAESPRRVSPEVYQGFRSTVEMERCARLIARFDDSVNEESCGLNYPTLQAAMLEKLPRLRTFDLNLAGLHNISPSSFDSFMPDPEHFSTRALFSGKNTEFPVIA
ncbi:predicted protein [Coccidioides posadasii str. Silveira]|uniref:Predicted protein n=1 Tax=Coccidioides posadasii (strain RMSCC 757 / Silveira) TaxID=443226 RepID=E9D274_COCPS|nr:predicted protein [Coccidioides posadasii str. Silveira]